MKLTCFFTQYLAVYIVKRLEDRADAKTVSDNDKTGHR